MYKSRNDFAKSLPGHAYGIELGVARGDFSELLLEQHDTLTLYSIDKYDDHHDFREYMLAHDRLHIFGARSHLLKMTFEEAEKCLKYTKFDFVYIDGYAHNGQDNGKTLRDWWPRVKEDGIFAGHDYSNEYPQNILQINAFCQSIGRQFQLTTDDKLPSWWIRR